MDAQQLTLFEGHPPVLDGFWCCGDCHPVLKGGTSLIWQPPDYRAGECVLCGRRYEFAEPYGGMGGAENVRRANAP